MKHHGIFLGSAVLAREGSKDTQDYQQIHNILEHPVFHAHTSSFCSREADGFSAIAVKINRSKNSGSSNKGSYLLVSMQIFIMRF